MEKGNASAISSPRARPLPPLPLPRSLMSYLGRGLFWFLLTMQGLGAFTLITLGVMITRLGDARQMIRPRVFQEVSRAELRLLPMYLNAVALGARPMVSNLAVITARLDPPGSKRPGHLMARRLDV